MRCAPILLTVVASLGRRLTAGRLGTELSAAPMLQAQKKAAPAKGAQRAPPPQKTTPFP